MNKLSRKEIKKLLQSIIEENEQLILSHRGYTGPDFQFLDGAIAARESVRDDLDELMEAL